MDSMDLIDENYALTKSLPDYEKFGLRLQMNSPDSCNERSEWS